MVNDISSKTELTVQPSVQPQSNVVELKQAQPKPEDVVSANQPETDRVTKSEKMEQTASRLNEIAQTIQRDLRFSVDDNSGDVVITVVDRETDEVIRQIPEEHVLAIRENIESLKGILFSAKI
jgi:flagellar protein FlaG